jgi:hypothetical protein
MASTPRTAAPKKRYCGMCETYTNANPCKACGAETDRVPPEPEPNWFPGTEGTHFAGLPLKKESR